MKTRRIALGPVLVALVLTAGICHGEILTFAFEGTVERVNDSLGLLDWIQPGDRTTYTFTFDSDTPPSFPPQYLAEYPGISAEFTAATRSFAGSAPLITVHDHSNGGMDFFNVRSSFAVDGMDATVYFILVDHFGNALSDYALPSEPYDLSRFPHEKDFDSTVFGPPPSYPTYLTFWGAIDSFYVAPPEPSSILLILLATFALTARRR